MARNTEISLSQYFEMQSAFNKRLKEIRDSINTNSIFLNEIKYQKLVEAVRIAKDKQQRNLAYNLKLLKRYDVIEIDGIPKLIVPNGEKTNEPLYYVTDEQLFDILHKTHIDLGHRGRDRMITILRKKYKNITYSDAQLYLDVCLFCKSRKNKEKKDQNISPETNSDSICDIALKYLTNIATKIEPQSSEESSNPPEESKIDTSPILPIKKKCRVKDNVSELFYPEIDTTDESPTQKRKSVQGNYMRAMKDLANNLKQMQKELIEEFFKKEEELMREEHEFQRQQDEILMSSFQEQTQLLLNGARTLLSSAMSDPPDIVYINED